MSVKKAQSKKDGASPAEISDDDLDQAVGGFDAGAINTNVDLSKDGVMIQNIGFPDDSGGGTRKVDVGDKSSISLNPSRTYKKT